MEYFGIWDSDNGTCCSLSISDMYKAISCNRNKLDKFIISTFFSLNKVRIVAFGFICTGFPNSLEIAKHLSVSCFMFHSPLCCPHFALAFLLNFSAPCAVVPGYSQVSGGRMDLFCCFGSPISVGSHGKGWGGSTTHGTGPTTLMCPHSGPLLHAAWGLAL